MRLCLHGERAEAHKKQVRDVSVSNVRQHKKGDGEERTRASSREVLVSVWVGDVRAQVKGKDSLCYTDTLQCLYLKQTLPVHPPL